MSRIPASGAINSPVGVVLDANKLEARSPQADRRDKAVFEDGRYEIDSHPSDPTTLGLVPSVAGFGHHMLEGR